MLCISTLQEINKQSGQMKRTLQPQEQSTSLTFKYSRFIQQLIQKQQFYLFLEVERSRPKAIKSVNRLIGRLKRPFFYDFM